MGAGDIRFTHSHLPVIISFNGDVALVLQKTEQLYLGLLEINTGRALSQLCGKCVVHLDASVVKASRAQNKKTEPTQAQITIYGQNSDEDDVGRILSEHKTYLQHPQPYNTSVRYSNPQYFVVPGEDLVLPDEYGLPKSSRVPMSKLIDDVLGVFEGAGTATEYSEVNASSRLKTELKKSKCIYFNHRLRS